MQQQTLPDSSRDHGSATFRVIFRLWLFLCRCGFPQGFPVSSTVHNRQLGENEYVSGAL